jgi:pimeloyl-ACP methyl ester carboxylesterase
MTGGGHILKDNQNGKKQKIARMFVALGLAAVVGMSAMAVSLQAKVAAASPIQWAPCEGAPTTPIRECAVIQVPLDYANPSKGTTDLHIARVLSTNSDPTKYKGSLLVLTGGPPSAGVDFVGYANDLNRSVAPEVRASYDLIGIQQLGSWDGVPCLSDQPLKNYWETNHLPKNTTELNKVTGLEKQFNQGCANPSNALVPYMNTQRSIRDMETVRQALSVDKLNLLAYSYGTALAHGYMSQYPSHVGRAVLDSVVDRSQTDQTHDKENNVAYDKSWQIFKDWCQADTACTLHGQNLDQVFDKTLATARTTGIPAPRNPFGNRPLNDWELTVGVEALTGAGEGTRIWASTILSDAATGDGSQAEYLYDLLTGRRDDGSYVGGDGTRRTYTCNDSTWSQIFRTPQDVQNWSNATQQVAPRYGAASVFQGVAQCYGWPFKPASPMPRNEPVANSNGALLINADNDASTPLIWAKRVQAQIPNSRMVVVKGATHLQIPHSRCAAAYSTAYLLKGTLPKDGVACTYDADLNPPQLPPDLGPLPMRKPLKAPVSQKISPELLANLREEVAGVLAR